MRRSGAVLGIDIGGTTTQVIVLDAREQVRADITAPTVHFDPDGLVTATIDLARRALEHAGVAVEAAGIGIPGMVEPLSGTVAHAVNLGLGTEPLALGPAVGRVLGCEISMENDVRAAALEALAMAAVHHPGLRDVTYVNLGTGVAAGMVADGRVVTGPRRIAGEIGHVPFRGDVRCACGLVGCLETVLSGPAVARRWPSGGADAARALFAAAESGDPAAAATADAVISDLVTLVQWLAATTGTAAFVLGGGVATSHPSILRRVHAEVALRTGRSGVADRTLDAARIHVAPAGHPTGALGAAALARSGPTVLPVGLLGRTEVPKHDEKEHR